MIETVAKNPGGVTLHVTVRRLAVYLDNWALIALAKDQGQLRDRFLGTLGNGADVLFSVTNAAEIVGPAGASQDAVRDFFTAKFATLDKHWKRRIESLPKPNSLASVYYEPELDRFVADLETAVAASPYLRHPTVAAAYGLDAN